jgi:hypothetical protein
MKPCFVALQRQIQSFVRGLVSDNQIKWDIRFDFLAYSAGTGPRGQGTVYVLRSLYASGTDVTRGLYAKDQKPVRFFTSDLEEFARGIENVEVTGDEASFVALDLALDYPWRAAAACHRVVILMTDEPLETGLEVEPQVAKIGELIDKIHALKVKLFLVGPPSDAFDKLSAADGSEYEVVQNSEDGLRTLDFRKVLEQMGKSVSVSNPQSLTSTSPVRRSLFGQSDWTAIEAKITGR